MAIGLPMDDCATRAGEGGDPTRNRATWHEKTLDDGVEELDGDLRDEGAVKELRKQVKVLGLKNSSGERKSESIADLPDWTWCVRIHRIHLWSRGRLIGVAGIGKAWRIGVCRICSWP